MFSTTKLFLLAILVLGLTLTGVPSAESRIRLKRQQQQVQAGDAQTVTLTQGGVQREFLVHVPAGGLPARPGAVLVFHGGGGSGGRVMGTSAMNTAADQGGFLAVYPNAIDGKWNNGKSANAGSGDDVGFVRALIKVLEQDYGVEPGRVFATGISNGGGFVYKLACDAPGLVAAIAPVAANMSQALRAECAPGRGTPVVMFSGTDDPLMPYQGGITKLVKRNFGPDADQMVSSPDTAQFWGNIDGCGGPASAELPDQSNDDTTVTRIDFPGCNSGEVVLYRINGGGHSWPGSSLPERRITGNTSQDISATALMIQFFRRHGL